MSVTQEKWSIDQVMYEMSREAALDLWTSLPAPTLDELDGEYTGSVHDGGDPVVREAKAEFFCHSPRGFWLGKAYQPGDDGKGAGKGAGKGEGHNLYRDPDGTVQRHLRFATEIGSSTVDGRPSLIMTYRAFGNEAGAMDLVDEIRCLGDGVYLGVYTCTVDLPGFSIKKPGQARSELDLFALTGPNGPWVGVDDPQLEVH